MSLFVNIYNSKASHPNFTITPEKIILKINRHLNNHQWIKVPLEAKLYLLREVLFMLWLLFAYNFSKCYWKLYGVVFTSYGFFLYALVAYWHHIIEFVSHLLCSYIPWGSLFNPEPCSSKCTPWARRISITWAFLGAQNLQAHWITICSLTRSPWWLESTLKNHYPKAITVLCILLEFVMWTQYWTWELLQLNFYIEERIVPKLLCS